MDRPRAWSSLLAGLTLMVLVAGGSPAMAATSLRLALPSDGLTPQPGPYSRFASSGTSYPVLMLLFDALFWPDTDNLPQPWLVKDYQVSPGGTRYTLRLRDGVRFHDGRALTADDVKFTYEYLGKYANPHFTPQIGGIRSVDAPDAATVVFTLDEPNASFLLQPLAFVPIFPRHLWEGVTEPGKQTEGASIGSGPYKLAEYQPDQFYRLQANADYFRGRPAIDEITLPIIKETNATFSALKAGEIDATSVPLAPQLVSEFESAQGLKVVRGPGFVNTILQFNDREPPFNRKEVRQAVALAVDRQALVDTLLLGYGVPGSPGYSHPSLPWANPRVSQPQRDVARANQLLDSAGYAERWADGTRVSGDGQRLQFPILAPSGNAVQVRTAELIVQQLEQTGVAAEVKTLESLPILEPYRDQGQVADYQGAIFGWSAPTQADPDFLRRLFHSSHDVAVWNIGGYGSPEFDAVSSEEARTLDADRRTQLLFRMQEILADDVPVVNLYFPDAIYAYRPAAYDGWVFIKGKGVVDKLSFVGRPAQGNSGVTAAAAGPQNVPLIIGAVIMALVALAGGLAILRSRRT